MYPAYRPRTTTSEESKAIIAAAEKRMGQYAHNHTPATMDNFFHVNRFEIEQQVAKCRDEDKYDVQQCLSYRKRCARDVWTKSIFSSAEKENAFLSRWIDGPEWWDGAFRLMVPHLKAEAEARTKIKAGEGVDEYPHTKHFAQLILAFYRTLVSECRTYSYSDRKYTWSTFVDVVNKCKALECLVQYRSDDVHSDLLSPFPDIPAILQIAIDVAEIESKQA